MADQTVPLQLGSKGLNRDIPAFNLPPEIFDSGINMRFKDGSIQVVPQTQLLNIGSIPNLPLGITPPEQTINPLIAIQYAPDGSSFINPIMVGLDVNNKLISGISAYNPGNLTSQYQQVPIPTELQQTGFSNTYSVDSFVFNGLHIIAPKNQLPIYWNANATTTPTYKVIPNWLTTGRFATAAVISNIVGNTVTINTNVNSTVPPIQTNFYIASGDNASGKSQTRISYASGTTIVVDDASVLTVGDIVYVAYPFIPRGMTQFENRLVAFNMKVDVPNGYTAQYQPLQLAWSQPIDQIQSLDDVVWFASSTNSAGADYLTDSPGEILAAGLLNQYLIVYKSDSVYLVQDAGSPYYLTPQLLFPDDGIIGPRTFVAINSQQHFVVGVRGIYMHQGSTTKQNISRGRIEEAFYRGPDAIDLNYRGIAFCYHNILEKEVWVCYKSIDYTPDPTTTGGIVGCNKAYCYQYLTDTWYQRTLDNVTSIVDIEAGAISVSVVSQPLVDPGAAGGAFVNSPGFMYGLPFVEYNSEGIFEPTSYVQFNARDISNASIVKSINGVYPHCTNICNLQISTSNYYSNINWNNVVTRTFDPVNQQNYRLDYRLTGRYLYMTISGTTDSSNGLTVNPYFSKLDVNFEARGRR